MVSTRFNIRETDIYFLVGKALKSAFGISQNALFFEVPIGESRADILYVQTPEPYETALPAGIHVFEVKMGWDTDRARLTKQAKDYMGAADYVWVIGVNSVPKKVHDRVGVLVFSTNGCSVGKVDNAAHCHGLISMTERQMLLASISKRLLRKARKVDEMAYVNQEGEVAMMVQMRLGQ